MGITYSGLIGADFGALETAGESWKALSDTLESEAGTIEQLKAGGESPLGQDNWDGDTAGIGRDKVREIVVALDDRAANARRVWTAIVDAAEEFKGAQADLNDAIAGIDPERAVLTETGSVIPNTAQGTDNIYYAEGLASQITAALQRATEADDALKAAIGVWAETFSESERLDLISQAGDEADELQDLIDSGASPDQINDWWNGLSESERLGILEGDPALIAGLDGIPTDTRDAANRDLLDAELDRFDPGLDSEIADLEARIAEIEASAGDRMDSSAELYELNQQLEDLRDEQARRDSLTALQEAVAGQAPTGQDYYLLGYDSAEDGKAIVSIGNPDTADNTAVYVPGTKADLEGFPGEIERAEDIAGAARESAPDQETAVIAWLDYNAPNDIPPNWENSGEFDEGAGFMRYAEEAGPVLSQFTHGLEATNESGDSHTTVIGHSYGTTVVGHAAAEYGLETDKIIAVASPGLDTEHAEDLGIGAENVYATTADGDAILATTDSYSWVEGVWEGIFQTEEGRDPDGDGAYAWHGEANPLHDDYGATEFASDSLDKNGNESTDGTDIHSGYFHPDNVALENMSYIITGQPEEIRQPEGDGS